MFARFVLALTAAALVCAPVHAQKKKPELTDFPFWTTPKVPHARAFAPGLAAALQLTPEQTEKLLAARAATVDRPELRALKTKGDPNATPDELAKARAEATEKLFKEVDAILTRDQKALIEKMNDTYAKVQSAVAEDFAFKLQAAKGNAEDTASLRKEQAEVIVSMFAKKLEGLLNNEQMAAVKKAAEEEAKRAAATDKPKPKK